MVITQPLPLVIDFVDAVDEAVQEHHPGQGLSALQRSWWAFCLTAIFVTNAVCWARFERASLGTSSLAAFSWMFRHAKMPWELLLVASVRLRLRHDGITHGSLVVDDPDTRRTKAAQKMASLHTRRDNESGGCLLGQRLVFLLFVTPKITLPLGFAFYMPAPELTAWYKPERRLKQQGIPPTHRPPKPPPNPPYPTQPALALGLLAQCTEHHPDLKVHSVIADALSGSAGLMNGASALFGGVPVMSPLRSHQKVRVYKREQHVADYVATHPGTPRRLRIRGGDEMVASVGRGRLSVGAHHTKRCVIAVKYAGEATSRDVLASDLSWRTLDIVPAHPLRWLVEVVVQDWKTHEGWGQLTKQPGEEGSRRSLILSRLVDHGLCFHPDQHAQRKNNRPASTVGSLRAQVQVECFVTVLQELFASEDHHAQLSRFNQALHEVFA